MSELALVDDRAVSDRNEEQLVTMSVEGQLFGLPILSVQDIVETHNITQVPRTPSAISGIMNLRGRIVTVINLRRILGRNDDSSSRMGVTVDFHGDLYTILVDEIGEVRLLDRSDFESAPATLDPKLKQLCTGIYRLDGELLAVLDVNQILSAETIAQTPPIQFIARRQKEVKDNGKAATKALSAPANDEAEHKASAQEPNEQQENEAAVTPKQGKNIFRKQKSVSNAKSVAKRSAADDGAEPEEETEKPARKSASVAPAKPKSAGAKSAPAAASRKAEAGAVKSRPAVSATDVAPGSPKATSRTENLLELVGGEDGVTKIVGSFYEHVMGDKSLASHYEGADMQSQAEAMRSFLCAALKGQGDKPTVAAPGHKWLSPDKGIGDEGFNKCLAHFESVLQDRSVPDGTIFRVLAVIERYRESVVD